MNSGEIFVIFVIPAIMLTVAYLAMRANEWAIRRDDRKSGE
ncbi:hypothetical protein ACFZ8E_09520 [Methylobacterium sp. HMF5984]|jgi:hypothetical protein|nr:MULTISPECIES: hypothetical protein [unclassified Methylobacterium]